jgi:SAM-dependent methyltransferase
MEQQMFAQSEAYERFMGRWSRLLAPQLVKLASVPEAASLLEIGSGTGALAAALLDASSSVRVTGVDLSSDYVRYAQGRNDDERVQFVVGNAQALQFDDATFDGALSMLVLNFIPDPGKALREVARVTRPGGRVTAAVWDYGEGMEMLRVFWDEAVALNPSVEARDERHMPLSRRGELSALWRASGLEQVVEQPVGIDMRFASFADYWQPFLGGQGPAGAYAISLPQPARDALEARVHSRLLGAGGDRPFTIRARAWAVTGIVPNRNQITRQ